MTRQPNPKSKTATLILRGNNEDEDTRIRALKEICVRNNLQIRKVLLDKINLFLREHNWPPGNSQTLLFQESLKKCGKCKQEVKHLSLVEYVSSSREWLCDNCVKLQKKRSVFKKVLAKK